MKPHLEFAHSFWKTLLQPDDSAIDATAGNGHDTLFLSKLLPRGKLYAVDIQETAIKKTRLRLEKEPSSCQVELLCCSHATFPDCIPYESVRLIVYNLGYLPGGDKGITTLAASTLTSLKNALPLIKTGGVISLTLYPGHPEGHYETQAVLAFAKNLKGWKITHKCWEKDATPSVLLMTNDK